MADAASLLILLKTSLFQLLLLDLNISSSKPFFMFAVISQCITDSVMVISVSVMIQGHSTSVYSMEEQ